LGGKETMEYERLLRDDWKSFEIHAFDVRVLEKTCREVTKSPTWTFKDD